MSDETEDRYEAIELIVKRPAEGDSWFDRIFDLVTESCTSLEDADNLPDNYECPCGMQSMGGSEGTLDQCYDHQRLTEKWAFDVEAADLKMILGYVNVDPTDTEALAAFERLRKAAYWHDDFNEWVANLPDDDEEEDETED